MTNLKDKISSTPSICGDNPIQSKYQRLFHLGRELKSPKRSLEALGFGKHGIYLVHLHSTQPKTLELSSDEDDAVEIDASSSLKRKKGAQEKIVVDTTGGGAGTTGGESAVVDLLESDGDNDSDIAEVLPETSTLTTKKLRRSR